MEFAATFFWKVLDVLVAPVTRQLGYLCNYGSNVQELRTRAEKLRYERERMMVRCGEADRNGENIPGDVDKWLKDIERKIEDIEEFQKHEGHQTTGCSNCSFPNLFLRHKLGRQAKKMIPDCDNLLNEPSSFTAISYRPEPEASDVTLCHDGYERVI